MTRVVVFGGSGFIGSAICAGIEGAVAPSRSLVDLAHGESIGKVLRRGDLVVNAAGYAAATDRTAGGLRRLRAANVDAVRTLAEQAARAEVAQLIHISSVAAMGRPDGPMLTEDQMVEPETPYGVSKRDAELILARYKSVLPITILRPTSVFGEGRGLARMLCTVARLPLVPLPSGGDAHIPFTYVENVTAAVRLALGTSSCFGRTFIVGDEQSYPLREIVVGLAHGMGRRRVQVLAVPVGALHGLAYLEARLRRPGRLPILDRTRIDTLTRSVSYSIDAFREATGYRPPVSLRVATQRIGAWYRNKR